MNLLIFIAQLFIVFAFIWGSLRLGKEALIALISLLGILANLFVIKQIDLFHLTITCSDVFAVGCLLSLNLLQECFGKKTAQKGLYISLLFLFFFNLMANVHLLYLPAQVDRADEAFQLIFASSWRIVLSSIFTFWVVQKADLFLFSFFKGSLKRRMFFSLFISQLIDTVLFSFLALYGLVHALFDVILMSVMTKTLMILILSPMTHWMKGRKSYEVSV